MSGPSIPSRILHATRGLSQPTAYGKRMDRLSNRIFGEVQYTFLFYIFSEPYRNDLL